MAFPDRVGETHPRFIFTGHGDDVKFAYFETSVLFLGNSGQTGRGVVDVEKIAQDILSDQGIESKASGCVGFLARERREFRLVALDEVMVDGEIVFGYGDDLQRYPLIRVPLPRGGDSRTGF